MSASPRVLRKPIGHFLEDFVPGAVYRHKGGKTLTEGLFTTFTEFSMTTNPLAKNARYARAYGFDGLVCPPGLVMLVAFSQTVEDVSENARANLEYIDMRFGAPVYVGDTIEVETKVLGVTGSRSNPRLGVVHVQSTARKNRGARDEAAEAVGPRIARVLGERIRRHGELGEGREQSLGDRLAALVSEGLPEVEVLEVVAGDLAEDARGLRHERLRVRVDRGAESSATTRPAASRDDTARGVLRRRR